MSSHSPSHDGTGQAVRGDGMQFVIGQWIKSIKEARNGSSGQSDDIPSPEEWQAALLKALPDQYED